MKYPRLEVDVIYPEMYRVYWAKDNISDMVNKTRAKDAIVRWNESERVHLNQKGVIKPLEARGCV